MFTKFYLLKKINRVYISIGVVHIQFSRVTNIITQIKNGEELVIMIAVEHLPFIFGENIGFINYSQQALNHDV